MRALAGVVMCRRTGLAAPFAPFADLYEHFRLDNRWGWGNGEGGLRRLHQRGTGLQRGFAQVDLDAGGPWKLTHRRDHAALDEAWKHARDAGGHTESYIALLPCDVVGCFAPARRRVMLNVRTDDHIVEEREVAIPSLWEIV